MPKLPKPLLDLIARTLTKDGVPQSGEIKITPEVCDEIIEAVGSYAHQAKAPGTVEVTSERCVGDTGGLDEDADSR